METNQGRDGRTEGREVGHGVIVAYFIASGLSVALVLFDGMEWLPAWAVIVGGLAAVVVSDHIIQRRDMEAGSSGDPETDALPASVTDGGSDDS